jgi:GDPmannose 4,6-dehydratase
VTRKITRAAAAISMGLQKTLSLGSLDGRRDWGYAPEYVDAMWRMLQQPAADDFVVATGTAHSVKDFLAASFDAVGLNWEEFVTQDPRYMRPSEGTHLVGDPSRASESLQWTAETQLPRLAEIMVQSDLDALATSPQRAET